MIEKDTIYCKLRKPIMMDNASEDNWGAIFLPLEKDVSDIMTHRLGRLYFWLWNAELDYLMLKCRLTEKQTLILMLKVISCTREKSCADILARPTPTACFHSLLFNTTHLANTIFCGHSRFLPYKQDLQGLEFFFLDFSQRPNFLLQIN